MLRSTVHEVGSPKKKKEKSKPSHLLDKSQLIKKSLRSGYESKTEEMLRSIGGGPLNSHKEYRNRNILFQSQIEKEEQHSVITEHSGDWSASISSATFASRYEFNIHHYLFSSAPIYFHIKADRCHKFLVIFTIVIFY